MPTGVYRRTKKHKRRLAENLKKSRGTLGKKFSEEHKRKLSEAKLRNPVRYWLGRKDKPRHTKKTRRQMSISQKQVREPYRNNPKQPIKWVEYNGQKFRSSWEARFAKTLDKRDIEWKYELRTFELGDSTYTPDFYLPERKEYWEIKGWLSPSSKEKLKRFRKKYPKIKLVLADKSVLKRIKNFFEMRI